MIARSDREAPAETVGKGGPVTALLETGPGGFPGHSPWQADMLHRMSGQRTLEKLPSAEQFGLDRRVA